MRCALPSYSRLGWRYVSVHVGDLFLDVPSLPPSLPPSFPTAGTPSLPPSLISALLPVKDGEKWVEDAVRSVMSEEDSPEYR